MAGASPGARTTVLAALGEDPVTTSQLYDSIGYRALLAVGLIDYRAFRRVLGALEADGLVVGEVADEDEGTRWRAVRPGSGAGS